MIVGFLKSVVTPRCLCLRVRETTCTAGTCGLTGLILDVIRQGMKLSMSCTYKSTFPWESQFSEKGILQYLSSLQDINPETVITGVEWERKLHRLTSTYSFYSNMQVDTSPLNSACYLDVLKTRASLVYPYQGVNLFVSELGWGSVLSV